MTVDRAQGRGSECVRVGELERVGLRVLASALGAVLIAVMFMLMTVLLIAFHPPVHILYGHHEGPRR